LKAADFDKFFLSVNYIPFLRFCVAVDDVASFEEAFGVERFGICFGIFEVASGNSGTSNTEFSSSVECCDILAVVINDPIILCKSTINFSRKVRGRILHVKIGKHMSHASCLVVLRIMKHRSNTARLCHSPNLQHGSTFW
jgi:hypothetical protein